MTPARKLSFQYVRQGAPETLLAFLLRRFRYHTPEEWRDRITSGAVTVDGRSAQAERVLSTKERIAYVPPPIPEPPVDARFTILYEDRHLIVVSKSANIPTSPSGKYWYNCLRHVLQRELNLPELHAVHRLDRDTSGVNLFAKTRDAAAKLGASFATGAVEKHYAAILRGSLPAREVLVSAPLRDAGGEIQIKQAVHPGGRPSVTRFRLRARLQGASLVGVLPLTGRTHQIRVHAAFLGTPVWGDRLYGVSTETFLTWVRMADRYMSGGHCLHATRLVFRHPEGGRRVDVGIGVGGLMMRWRG
jgi:RluA family pseudouridine synthase